MSDIDRPSEDWREPCCKIGRGIKRYDRSGLNDQLVEKYQSDAASLRDLEKVTNSAFVQGVLENVPSDTVKHLASIATADPGNIISALTGEDKQRQARIETVLEQAGINVAQLRNDFVTYRTVKNHLNQCLDVDTSQQTSDPISMNDAAETIDWAEERCERVIMQTIERFARTREDAPENVSVYTTTRVTCNECGTTRPITALLRDGCDCTN